MSEVTKIHTVDGRTITVDRNFIADLNNRKLITNFQAFEEKILVNMNNVTFMEVVEDDKN